FLLTALSLHSISSKPFNCNFLLLNPHPVMYGGDEVSAIVIDLGSHTCKAGYAGEDAPKAVFPSVVGAIDQMDIDGPVHAGVSSGSAVGIQNNKKNHESDRTKEKCKLYIGSQSLGYRRDYMELLSPLKNGVIVDWNIVDNIWDHALRECLLVDPKERPMLLAEQCSNTQEQRERAAELMFEKYKVPALFLAKNAVLTSFASGRATSLVVDRLGTVNSVRKIVQYLVFLFIFHGAGSTTVAPVLDGYVLQKALVTLSYLRRTISDRMLDEKFGSQSQDLDIHSRKKEISPGNLQVLYSIVAPRGLQLCGRTIMKWNKDSIFIFSSLMPTPDLELYLPINCSSLIRMTLLVVIVDLDFPHTTEGYKLYCQRVIVEDIKECVCRTPDSPYDESAYSNIPMTPYELPDGQIIEVGSDRFKIPDILFNPSLVQVFQSNFHSARPLINSLLQYILQTIPGMEIIAEIASSLRSLPKIIIESINKCDVDIRRELFSTILVTFILIWSLLFHRFLSLRESPQAARVKVFASGNATERRFSVWIGGSILASLGSFQQMWFSKSDVLWIGMKSKGLLISKENARVSNGVTGITSFSFFCVAQDLPFHIV
ncbi:hypothetical protein V8G54_027957, partial [Vigna mungo]